MHSISRVDQGPTMDHRTLEVAWAASGAKLVSVNVGMPRTVEHNGRTVTTGIWKRPVSGRVQVSGVNLDGDGQADRSVHGAGKPAGRARPNRNWDPWLCF